MTSKTTYLYTRRRFTRSRLNCAFDGNFFIYTSALDVDRDDSDRVVEEHDRGLNN